MHAGAHLEPEMADIALNFFAIEPARFPLLVFRGEYREGASAPDRATRRRLTLDGRDFRDYWVSPVEHVGFERHNCFSDENRELTKDLIFDALKSRCQESLSPHQYRLHPRELRRRVLLLLQEHPEGRQEVWLEPYYLARAERFGLLADFTFTPAEGHRGTRRAQQLALSLDHRFQANTDFYADRFNILDGFVRTYQEKIFALTVATSPVTVSRRLTPLPAASLDTKTYLFAGERSSRSQFMGVKEHGPLAPAPEGAQLYFLYREQDRGLSQDLYRALTGESFRTFPGFEEMFRFPIGRSNVTGMAIAGFTPGDLTAAADAVRQHANGRPAVPVVITPFSSHDEDEVKKEPYWYLKHAFLSRGLPSQVVSLDLLKNSLSFKWAVSNVGLGIFAKLGATPWKVKPRTERCLIVGIGQAHCRHESGRIDKYLAYAVLTDSSGVYAEMRILGESSEEDAYLNQLRATLRATLTEYAPRFSSFVIHATFKIRRRELDAVRQVLGESETPEREGRLVAMKFNDDSKFFGYATAHNSRVPFESSFVQLDNNDYLVWFEGLQYHSPNVRKRYARPVHVSFEYPRGGIPDVRKRDYLQDAINLSGANWRGFNAKSLPVSTYYAKLIARHIVHFQALGLPDVNFTHMPPWFL